MSAIASFIQLPKSALAGLQDAALPKKRLFRAPFDGYHQYLDQQGTEVTKYPWSGYVLATLLSFLEEEHQIDLMKSEFDDLSTFLTNKRGVSTFFFTKAHRDAYFDLLGQPFSTEVLRDYYNEFNGCDEPEVGGAMLDGIKAFRQSIERVDDDSVILFSIG